MEFLTSKRLRHAVGLSKLISKSGESLQETVIATLRLEREMKYDYTGIISDNQGDGDQSKNRQMSHRKKETNNWAKAQKDYWWNFFFHLS